MAASTVPTNTGRRASSCTPPSTSPRRRRSANAWLASRIRLDRPQTQQVRQLTVAVLDNGRQYQSSIDDRAQQGSQRQVPRTDPCPYPVRRERVEPPPAVTVAWSENHRRRIAAIRERSAETRMNSNVDEAATRPNYP